MKCQNEHCKTGVAKVLLTQNVIRPVWMCPFCAAMTLRVINPDSFRTIKEKPMIDYRGELNR